MAKITREERVGRLQRLGAAHRPDPQLELAVWDAMNFPTRVPIRAIGSLVPSRADPHIEIGPDGPDLAADLRSPNSSR